jgi:hypothetical protein
VEQGAWSGEQGAGSVEFRHLTSETVCLMP